jgi:hypothetical protein
MAGSALAGQQPQHGPFYLALRGQLTDVTLLAEGSSARAIVPPR